jgi:hypothetical protein
MPTRALLLASLAFSIVSTANAQAAPAAGSNWQRVEALPVGTIVELRFKARHHMMCTVKAVTDDTLTCVHDIGFGTKDEAITRGEVKSVKIAHRGRSAVYGSMIGAGLGAAGGGIAGKENNYFSGFHAAFALMFTFVGGIAGAYLTDCTASTVYRAN